MYDYLIDRLTLVASTARDECSRSGEPLSSSLSLFIPTPLDRATGTDIEFSCLLWTTKVIFHHLLRRISTTTSDQRLLVACVYSTDV
jgi:hypothetical protein